MGFFNSAIDVLQTLVLAIAELRGAVVRAGLLQRAKPLRLRVGLITPWVDMDRSQTNLFV